MQQKPIDVPDLKLNWATPDDHCRALLGVRKAYFWWYMGAGRALWNFTLPFLDRDGRWWYQVKPGFCWPVEFLLAQEVDLGKLPMTKSFLGYQHIVEGEGNSRLIINVINDLQDYGRAMAAGKWKKAWDIRKGASNCELGLLTGRDSGTFRECAGIWNDLTARTGWKRSVGPDTFAESWGRLFEVPGVSIIVGREKVSGRVAGFLITKIIGDTAYVDTIASSTELMNTRVNDLLIHSFIKNAQKDPRIKKMHYAIVSYKESLESFKQSHGFKPRAFPAFTHFTPGIGRLIRKYNVKNYNRMVGNIEVSGLDEGVRASV